ncbi:MAG TPA: hypothetical protein VM689_18245 [Aliidongia sp.]|nr:hypothetical protein [Aliidongia sp.]
MTQLDEKQIGDLVGAVHSVELTPAQAANAARMLMAALAAAEAARLVCGGSFFDTEPANFIPALARGALR